MRPPLVRWASETRLLGTVVEGRPLTPRWQDRSPPDASVEEDPLDDPQAYFLRNRWPRGQVIRVERAEGRDSESISAGTEVVVFRWRRGSACELHQAPDSLPVGSRQHVTALLRPDSLWADGRPTYDVMPSNPGPFPGPPGEVEGLPLDVYVDFVATLPTEEEWYADCRRPVLRVQGWIAAHRGLMHPRIQAARRQVGACNREINGRADDFERWPEPDSLTPRFVGWADRVGCEPREEEWIGRHEAVRGRFLDSDGEQWAVLCPEGDAWRVLLVIFEEPPLRPEPFPRTLADSATGFEAGVRVQELARFRGSTDKWFLALATPEYFEYRTAEEFRGATPMPRPRFDSILLQTSHSHGEQVLALYASGDGWRSVRLRCCHWPDGREPLGAPPVTVGGCPEIHRGELLVRRQEVTQLQGEVLADSVPDRVWPNDDEDPRRGTPIGQAVEVEWLEEADGASLAVGDTVIVVHWRAEEDCDWTPVETLLPSGSDQYFSLRLRQQGSWLEGRPTFDATPLDLWPFPGAFGFFRVPLERYRDWVAHLPTEAEMGRDCRPAVRAVQAWLEEHSEYSRYPPLNNVTFLKHACDEALERKAIAMERPAQLARAGARDVPPHLTEWLQAERCRPLPGSDERLEAGVPVVAGGFVEAPAPQWAVLCLTERDFRLLIAVLGREPQTVELARLPQSAGAAPAWRLSAAPPEYFDWTSAREFRRRDPPPGPDRDVLILREEGTWDGTFYDEEPPPLAFYRGGGAWQHVGVRCCHWPPSPE